jgi:hypothetical protein
MERSKMTGKTASMAEIHRQSSPRPNKLTIKMPRTTINWKENPRRPRNLGVEISAEKRQNESYYIVQEKFYNQIKGLQT